MRSRSSRAAQSGALHTQPLVIVSPPQNAQYETSPQIPDSAQQVEVSARLNQAVHLVNVKLLLDSKVIGTFDSAPYRVLWQLALGDCVEAQEREEAPPPFPKCRY